MQADSVQSRQAGFVRCCLKDYFAYYSLYHTVLNKAIVHLKFSRQNLKKDLSVFRGQVFELLFDRKFDKSDNLFLYRKCVSGGNSVTAEIAVSVYHALLGNMSGIGSVNSVFILVCKCLKYHNSI